MYPMPTSEKRVKDGSEYGGKDGGNNGCKDGSKVK